MTTIRHHYGKLDDYPRSSLSGGCPRDAYSGKPWRISDLSRPSNPLSRGYNPQGAYVKPNTSVRRFEPMSGVDTIAEAEPYRENHDRSSYHLTGRAHSHREVRRPIESLGYSSHNRDWKEITPATQQFDNGTRIMRGPPIDLQGSCDSYGYRPEQRHSRDRACYGDYRRFTNNVQSRGFGIRPGSVDHYAELTSSNAERSSPRAIYYPPSQGDRQELERKYEGGLPEYKRGGEKRCAQRGGEELGRNDIQSDSSSKQRSEDDERSDSDYEKQRRRERKEWGALPSYHPMLPHAPNLLARTLPSPQANAA
jgi:hypothetical protein